MITTLFAALTTFPPQEGRWISTTVTPAILAARVDGSLAKLSRATVQYRFEYDGEVGHAYAACDCTIVAPNVFKLQVPSFIPANKQPMNYEYWIADGKRFGKALQQKEVTPQPLSKRPGTPAYPMAKWFLDFSTIIFSGLGQPAHPFAKLVTDASKTGYKVTVESRTILFQGHERTWYRLNLAKGKTLDQIVIDASGYLPVSVVNAIDKYSTKWVAVDWNLRPGKEFDPTKARFIKRGGTLGFSGAPHRSKG